VLSPPRRSTVDDVVTVGALVVVDDLGPARWLTESIRSFAVDVGSLVPATFRAYARVLHPAYNGGERVSWAQIADANHKIAHPQMQYNRLMGYASRYSPGYRDTQPGVIDEAPAVGMLPPDVATPLARTLDRHTTYTDDCWFAVWEGWGGLDEAFSGQPTFPLPARNYHLARGPLAAAAQSVGGGLRRISCNLWWPDDHAWCVATEIDLDSTYIGASEACIEELLANPDLEPVPLNLTAGITADSDALNPD
jgi:hypothetical protein